MPDAKKAIKGRHRSAEEWRELISAWKASGKSRRRWCQEQGLSLESLRRWAKRLRGCEAPSPVVELRHAVQPSKYIGGTRLRVNRDGVIELRGAVSEELLRLVLRVVSEAPHVC